MCSRCRSRVEGTNDGAARDTWGGGASPNLTGQPSDARRAERARRRVHGFGNIYQRGRIWWIVYHDRGAKIRESSKSTKPQVAKDLLKRRLGEIGRGVLVNPAAEVRVTVGDLLDTLVLDYQNRKNRTAKYIEGRIRPLRDAFGRVRAIDMTADRLERYKSARTAAGKAAATVNRELAALRRAFRIAVARRRVQSMPIFELLPERNARQGFLEPACSQPWWPSCLTTSRTSRASVISSGWRKGEIQTLMWGDVDRAAGVVILRAEHSKNGEPRTLALEEELAAVIERRWSARVDQERARWTPTVCPFVFQRDGRPIGDFRKAWASAASRRVCSGS